MAQNVKITILDEVWCVVHGLSGDHHNYLYDKYAIFAPNYFFNPSFKLGRWDGKIRFFQKTGKTYLYLIEELVTKIIRWGYSISIDDKRLNVPVEIDPINDQLFSHVNHLTTGQAIKLRQLQVDAVNAVLPHGNGTIVAGTGAGKTILCAALCQVYGATGIRTITIVPSTTLIGATKREYINCGLDTGEYSGDEKTPERQHVVSTWQAIQHNPKIVSMFQMVIVDEAHGLKGKVLTQLITEQASSIMYRFGVTGTMPKDPADAMAVVAAVGPVRVEIPAHELIEDGTLANLHISIMQLEEDLTHQYQEYLEMERQTLAGIMSKPPTYKQFKDGYFGDFAGEKAYLQRKEDRLQWMADMIIVKRETSKGNVLCLVDSIPFGRKLRDMIPNAIFVNGKDIKTTKDKQRVYDMFNDYDDLVVIATVHIAGVGISIDRIFHLFLIDIGKSFIRVIQAIGRGLRKSHDKDFVGVIDVCSDLKYSKKHLATRIGFYKEARYPHKKHVIPYSTM